MGMFDDVRASLGRCTSQNASFYYRFYEIFQARSPAIPPYFAKTNFSRQTQLLADGLQASILFAEGNETGRRALGSVRRSHSRRGWNVRPEHYEDWLESMIAVIQESDPEFSEALRASWLVVLNSAVLFIKGGYES